MTARIFIPRDAGALAVGADRVAAELERQAAARNAEIEIVRNGSRGLYWLEPMVEVETPQGRVAYGPVRRAGRCFAARRRDAFRRRPTHCRWG